MRTGTPREGHSAVPDRDRAAPGTVEAFSRAVGWRRAVRDRRADGRWAAGSAAGGRMDWIQFGVQWLHVIFAVFWFGGTMYLDFVLMPTLQKAPPASARDVGRALVPRMSMFMRVAALVVIVVGLLRGTVWGPLPPGDGSLSFGSDYGVTWSVSILIALAIAAIGDGVMGRGARRLYGDDALWGFASAGGPPPTGFVALAGRLRSWSLVQLVLFIAAFTCMILMRFGL